MTRPRPLLKDSSSEDTNLSRDQEALEALFAPILPAAKPKTELLSCRVPCEKNQALKHWCEAQGGSLSDYVRSRLYNEPLPQPRPRQEATTLDRQVLIELNRIGSNLNQTVRRLNRQNAPRLNLNDRAVLNQLLQTLNAIKEQLAE